MTPDGQNMFQRSTICPLSLQSSAVYFAEPL